MSSLIPLPLLHPSPPLSPRGYFISSSATTTATKGLKPGFFRWWQPVPAAALDVTNPEAVAWFVNRLKKLQVREGEGEREGGGGKRA